MRSMRIQRCSADPAAGPSIPTRTGSFARIGPPNLQTPVARNSSCVCRRQSRLHATTTFRVIIVDMVQFPKRRRARGFSLIELLIVIAIILIILAIAVPKLGSAKMNANEMAVIREIQTITSMQTQYQSQFGKYAATLAELGPPTSGGPGPQAADLIPGSLAAGEKDGYTFTMAATPQGYSLTVNPN